VVVGAAAASMCALVLLSGTASAQAQRSGNDAARVMQQLQQMSAERVALQADKARLEQEVADLKAKQAGAAAAGATAQNSRAAQRATAAEAKERETAAELERVRAQMQELIPRFRETAQTLKNVELERNQQRAKLGEQERALATCVDRNAGLYELNTEVLAHLEGRGPFTRLAEREPFLKLKRTELENLIDDYRYRVEELRLQRAAEVAAAPKK
jgi:chaperonin cofactor prefoldin